MEIDATQVVVALIGLTGAALAVWADRRGRRRQESVQDAANRIAEAKQRAELKLAERKQQFEESEAERASQDRLITRLYAEIDRLEDVNTRQRGARDADRAACDRAREELVGTITQLAGMVRDEVAQEAARFAIDHAARHEQTDH
ncbi:hypothetical protein N866_07225 [Actinotalea ferrariae CF5-4]|uniref:Uncharacterized protein n=1 Tax=Actinotalea ferrariae CF5-4 TaxID=948458 RepID=A0A021VU79_9CELL|nr:hypothetical protein N866_07225 [Actinotalea ferrariae CF5-4]